MKWNIFSFHAFHDVKITIQRQNFWAEVLKEEVQIDHSLYVCLRYRVTCFRMRAHTCGLYMCRSCWRELRRNTTTTAWCRSLCMWWRRCAPASTKPRDRWRSWRFWRNGSPTSKAGRWASTKLVYTVEQFDSHPSQDLLQCFFFPVSSTHRWAFPRQSSKSWLI